MPCATPTRGWRVDVHRAHQDDGRRYVGDYDQQGTARIWHVEGEYRREVARIVDSSLGGIAWGYIGAGPADAARMLLTDAAGDRRIADAYWFDFEEEVVDCLPRNERFELPVALVEQWLIDRGVHVPGRGPCAVEPRTGPCSEADLRAWQAELGEEQRRLDGRARQLDAREQAVVQAEARLSAEQDAWSAVPRTPQVTALPAEPVAREIRQMMADTGDGVGQVAKFLAVEPAWADDVLAGRITEVDVAHIQHLCEVLHCTPHDFWGAEAGRSIIDAYPPEVWPRFIEPLDAWPPRPLTDPNPPGQPGPPPPELPGFGL